MISVTKFGFGYLGLPIISTGLRQFGPLTAVTMPKAAVHKNDLTPRREYDVRITWEILAMQAEPIAH
jgi:hypothetical protein